MKCAWKELLAIVPTTMRPEVDRLGRDTLQELRLRLGKPPEMILKSESKWLGQPVTAEDISFSINAASRYSPWAAATSARGYITAPGGHRIGICGETLEKDGSVTGIRSPTSLCIRVARDFPGLAAGAAGLQGNLLILGPPGSGKTTLLRDIIRYLGEKGSVAVVDERGELFPAVPGGHCFEQGNRTDILTGCRKAVGISMALRTMGPSCIAVDEITDPEDCRALTEAGWCGVRLVATAHAGSLSDFTKRPVYQPLAAVGIFDTVIILKPDKSWRWVRMES